ncbi:hypothetical protein [Micromonospora chalcea]|uniref:hypothetical protein n=1 Tax=Micromonospora chalcea TaxID=1874 RepID=UPI003D74DC63
MITATTLTPTVAELLLLVPALDAALHRDAGTGDDERSGSSVTPGLPVNTDVLACMATLHGEVPATARWVSRLLGEPMIDRTLVGHLGHLVRWHDRLTATNATAEATQLVANVERWLRSARRVLGLSTPDRRLPEYCPVHDDPLTQLVVPGDEGWLAKVRGGYTVGWHRAEYVRCRHCGTTWAPGQYATLGRQLRDADRRRVEAAA